MSKLVSFSRNTWTILLALPQANTANDVNQWRSQPNQSKQAKIS